MALTNVRSGLLGMAMGTIGLVPAAAQIRPVDPSIEIVAATHGMSKGLAQTEGPQLFVRGELSFGQGFLASYAKNVEYSGDVGVEAGLVVGRRFGWAGFQFGATAAYKRLAGMSRAVDDDAIEFSLNVHRRLSRITARASVAYSPDELSSTRRSIYLEAGLAIELRPGTALSANIGRREITGGSDYTAFNLGVSHDLAQGISAELRYHDTDRGGVGEYYRRRLVASLRARF